MDIESAAVLEQLVNAYIGRALSSSDHLEEVAAAFDGLRLSESAGGVLDRDQLAHAIAEKLLGRGWYYDVVRDVHAGEPRVRIIGRS